MFREPLLMFVAQLTRWACHHNTISVHEGIRICDMTNISLLRDHFMRAVVKALHLLKKADPRRYRRVQRQLHYIAHSACEPGHASFDPRSRICWIDFTRLEFPQDASADDRVDVMLLAACLVRQATHGEIWQKGVRDQFRERLRERVVRLCHLEASRFLRQIDPRLGARSLEYGWAKRAYREYWDRPWWRRLTGRLKRERELAKSVRPAGPAKGSQPFRPE